MNFVFPATALLGGNTVSARRKWFSRRTYNDASNRLTVVVSRAVFLADALHSEVIALPVPPRLPEIQQTPGPGEPFVVVPKVILANHLPAS
jgi:hypothetical protein